jgi:hypothetical protein
LIGQADGSDGTTWTASDLTGSTAAPLDPLLGPLWPNGGPTPTMALLPGSAAIGAGDSGGLTTDQRWFARPPGAGGDIGAYQTQMAQPPATVVWRNLNWIYDGYPKFCSATTVPPGMPVSLTYNGLTNAPINAGSYPVIATVITTNYFLTATNTLVIAQASATVALSNLTQTYDGTAKSVSVTTAPPGLAAAVTYNGVTTAPTNAGSYTVVATVTDPNYQGAATNTLAIVQASGTIPTLRILWSGSNVMVCWPTNGAGFRLQSRTNLSTGSPWSAVTNVPAVVGDQFMVTDTPAAPSRFYRLVK